MSSELNATESGLIILLWFSCVHAIGCVCDFTTLACTAGLSLIWTDVGGIFTRLCLYHLTCTETGWLGMRNQGYLCAQVLHPTQSTSEVPDFGSVT